MEPTAEKIELNPEVAKSFSLAPGAPAVFENRKDGRIDIRTVTPEKVAALVKNGCKHFIAKDDSTKPEAPAKAKATA